VSVALTLLYRFVMKKTVPQTNAKPKKLRINAETVRELTPVDLLKVAGGQGCLSHTGISEGACYG
jgi:hypothetical protein